MALVEQATQEALLASGAEVSPGNAPSGISSTKPPQKKARIGPVGKKASSNGDRPSCRLEQIPLEILAEILSYVPYPTVILALARCSKYFCHILVNNPSTTFIWRSARNRCVLPCGSKLPEPTANFTEASYAAFVFDYGHCEICGDHIPRMYTSYSLRARICYKQRCRDTWNQDKLIAMDTREHPRYKGITSWIPLMETTHPIDTTARVRKQDWRAAVDEYNRTVLEHSTIEELVAKKDPLAKKLAAVYDLSKSLICFRDKWETLCATTQRSNETTAARIASREGWTLHELMGTRTYGLLHRSKTAILEKVTHEDYQMVRDQVDKEMVEHRTRVSRREAEAAYKMRREDVAAHYTRLKSAPNPVEVLPSLPEFRKLSVMKVLQGRGGAKDAGVGEELKDSKLVHALLANNLSQWREEARSALAGVLGFPGWRTASKKKVHPVDRLTARFICKKCSSKGKGGEALTFAEACGHRCACLNKKQRARETWSASLFEPDVKAIDAVTMILAAIGTTAEDLKARLLVDDMQSRLLCTACPAAIAMTFEMAVRHSKRHERPAFELASEDDARLHLYGACPVKSGLAARLIGGRPEERSKKQYACRHCQQAVREAASAKERATTPIRSASVGAADQEAVSNAAVDPVSNDSNAPQEEHRSPAASPQLCDDAVGVTSAEAPDTSNKRADRKAARMAKGQAFSFDGLRSHLKEKHRILHIGDEDIAFSPTLA